MYCGQEPRILEVKALQMPWIMSDNSCRNREMQLWFSLLQASQALWAHQWLLAHREQSSAISLEDQSHHFYTHRNSPVAASVGVGAVPKLFGPSLMGSHHSFAITMLTFLPANYKVDLYSTESWSVSSFLSMFNISQVRKFHLKKLSEHDGLSFTETIR